MTAVRRVADNWVRQILAAQSRKVIYTGVFLDHAAKQRLVGLLGQTHTQLYAHHMTIWVIADGGDPDLASLPLGKTVTLKVVAVAEDDKGQAVIVETPSVIKPQKRIPHITVSTALGVSPAYSKNLVGDVDKVVRSRGLPTIQGRVGWWDGQQERYDMPENGAQ